MFNHMHLADDRNCFELPEFNRRPVERAIDVQGKSMQATCVQVNCAAPAMLLLIAFALLLTFARLLPRCGTLLMCAGSNWRLRCCQSLLLLLLWLWSSAPWLWCCLGSRNCLRLALLMTCSEHSLWLRQLQLVRIFRIAASVLTCALGVSRLCCAASDLRCTGTGLRCLDFAQCLHSSFARTLPLPLLCDLLVLNACVRFLLLRFDML